MITTFKKSISVVLAIVMVLMSVCVFSTGVAAAENTFSVTVESTASDLFPTATSTFDASTEKVTVTYWYNLPDYSMVNSEWVLTYDSNALQYDETDGVNQKTERGVVKSYVMRSTNSSYTTVNVKKDENGKEEGRIVGNCSDPGGYPVDEGRVAFISVTFKVLKPVKDSTVNLDLKVMQVRGYDWEPAAKQVDFVKEGQIINEDVDYVSNPTYAAAYSGEFDEEYAPAIKTDAIKVYGSSVSLGDSFSINFYVLESVLEEYSNPYMVFKRDDKTVTVTNYTLSGGMYKFEYKNVYPQLLADEVVGVLYAEKDDVLYYSKESKKSIKTYAEGLLNKEQKPALRTLLVDMLNYGAEAQKYRKYKTDKLANAGLTKEQKSWASEDPELTDISNKNYEIYDGEIKATWYNAQVVLADTVRLMPIFTMDDTTNKTIEIKAGNRTFTYTEDDFQMYSAGKYRVAFDQLYANQMSVPVYITVYDNGVQCSNVCRYSIESYICKMHKAEYEGKDSMDPLLMSIIRYGKSAEAYGAAK